MHDLLGVELPFGEGGDLRQVSRAKKYNLIMGLYFFA